MGPTMRPPPLYTTWLITCHSPEEAQALQLADTAFGPQVDARGPGPLLQQAGQHFAPLSQFAHSLSVAAMLLSHTSRLMTLPFPSWMMVAIAFRPSLSR